MPPKKRLNDDAFSWVKNTAKGENIDPPKEKTSSIVKKTKTADKKEPETIKKAALSTTAQVYSSLTVYVQYDKNGSIISVANIAKQYLPQSGMPFTNTDGIKAAEFKVPLELEKESILEIHKTCIVRIIEGKPYLVKKQ